MIKKKEFKNDDDLLEFINNNRVEVISTHNTPRKYGLAADWSDDIEDTRLKLRVTLLYKEKKII